MFDSNVTVTVDTVSSMDISGNHSAIGGEDAGSLFETLEKIESDGAKTGRKDSGYKIRKSG